MSLIIQQEKDYKINGELLVILLTLFDAANRNNIEAVMYNIGLLQGKINDNYEQFES